MASAKPAQPTITSYAKPHKYTDDRRYLDVARVTLHDTESMLVLSARQYDMKEIGWQQEVWNMVPGGFGRGVEGHWF